MIQYLQKKFCCNIYFELWVLLFALYFLWFSSDDYLELNLKLVGCTVHLFNSAIGWPDYYVHYEKIKVIVLIIINFLYMMMIFVLPISIFLQAGFVQNLIMCVQNALHLHLYGTKLIKRDGKLIPLIIGNHNQFCF